jgi:phosphatidylglycerophosphate synthase
MAETPNQDDRSGKSGDRRPLASRNTGWAARLTALLLKTPVTPNQISILSIVFAAIAAAALFFAPRQGVPSAMLLYLLAAIGIQLRLLCNLLDGMVAVEGLRGGPDGALYNEAPDRIADSLIIIALGYAAGEPWLGWAGALAAALTAYIRVLGGSLGKKQDFSGPMAKPHRMALITLACFLAIAEMMITETRLVLLVAAWIVLAGSVLTVFRRLHRLRIELLRGAKS